MPFYDLRCDQCANEITVQRSMKDALDGRLNVDYLCDTFDCDGWLKQVFYDVNLSSDCHPTRSIEASRVAKTPGLKGLNPGHEPLNSNHLGLKPEQCARLGLK